MKRVLLTCDTIGGIWQYTTDLAEALLPLGIEPVVATLGPSPLPAQRQALGADIQLIDTGLPLDWLSTSASEIRSAEDALASVANRTGAELVQLHTPALAAGGMFDQPVVAVAHSCVGTWWQAVKGGRIDPDLGWRAELTATGLAKADCVVAPSAAFAAALQHCYRLPSPPCVVHNGRRPSERVHRDSAPFAFTAGRLWDEGKNLGVLDVAAQALTLSVYAAGALRGPNGAAVALNHVRCLGALSDLEIERQLAAQPVFVSTALYEPFGLAVLEAAQAGCALVLSDIPTFRELWDGAARFVYPHDAGGFARAVQEIAGDQTLRARLGEAAQACSARYSTARMAEAMVALYRQVQRTGSHPTKVAA